MTDIIAAIYQNKTVSTATRVSRGDGGKLYWKAEEELVVIGFVPGFLIFDHETKLGKLRPVFQRPTPFYGTTTVRLITFQAAGRGVTPLF